MTDRRLSLIGLLPLACLGVQLTTVDGFAATYVLEPPSSQIGLRIPRSGTGGSGTSSDQTRSTLLVNLPPDEVVEDINVRVTLDHTSVADLTLDLLAPDGLSNRLANRRGIGGPGYHGTVFDDEAALSIAQGQSPFTGAFRPEAALTDFDGVSPNGFWTLLIEDLGFGETGTLVSWALEVTTSISPLPWLQCDDAVIVEGDSGQRGAVFVVQLSKPALAEVTARYATQAVSATSGVDYVSVTGQLTIAPGETSFTVVVPVVGDVQVEPDELFDLVLTEVTGALVADGFGEGIIVNDDPDATTQQVVAAGDQVNLRIPPVEDGGTQDPAKDITVSSVVVSGFPNAASVLGVKVRFSAEHTYMRDLQVRLVSPEGAWVELVANRGSAEAVGFVGTSLEDHSSVAIGEGAAPFTGAYRPEQPLSQLLGVAANGVWTLEVEDVAQGDIGVLLGWTIEVVAGARSIPASPELRIDLEANQVALSWSRDAVGFVLEAQDVLGESDWQTVEQAPELSPSSYRVSLPLGLPPRFYRLRH